MSTMSKGGGSIESTDFNDSNFVYKLVKISKEKSTKFSEKELISYDYIKMLECEKEELNKKLMDKCKLIKDLNKDLKRMESERLLCMIYESYRRFKPKIIKDLESKSGMKIEAYLEAVKEGKILSDDHLVYWMISINNDIGIQLLKNFRNDYSHYTNTDLSILRQWRTRLLEDSENESIKNSTDNLLNEAALNILNNVIDYLSRPEARPLKCKRFKSTNDQIINPTHNKSSLKNMKVVKRSGTESSMMSKKQRKKLRKMILRRTSPSNAFIIEKLLIVEEGEDSNVSEVSRTNEVLLSVPCLLSVPRMVKEKANDIMCCAKKRENKQKKQKKQKK